MTETRAGNAAEVALSSLDLRRNFCTGFDCSFAAELKYIEVLVPLISYQTPSFSSNLDARNMFPSPYTAPLVIS